MANELVRVELIANPAVTRTMTVASYRNNTHKWRMVGQESASIAEPQKKSAEPVAVEIKPANQDGGTFIADPTVTVVSTEPTGLIDGLRAQYKAATGKDPDGRWGVKKLSEEIKTLTK